MENLSNDYKSIPGWGVDADPKNEPTYPMKKYTGDDHQRINYARPPLQPETIEVLHSNERPSVSAVFGMGPEPTGFSGQIRRYAFEYSEGRWTHWLLLLMADRVNAVEGIIDDLKRGHVPNIFAERGWGAEWKYNRKAFVQKIAVGLAVTAAVALLLSRKEKKRKRYFGW